MIKLPVAKILRRRVTWSLCVVEKQNCICDVMTQTCRQPQSRLFCVVKKSTSTMRWTIPGYHAVNTARRQSLTT